MDVQNAYDSAIVYCCKSFDNFHEKRIMKIEHVALWVSDLENMRKFYEKYFAARSNEKYFNPKTNFSSYFLSFDDSPRLEIMNRPDITGSKSSSQSVGYAHLAFSVGSKEKLLELTERLRQDGFEVTGEPRITGDGYFESVIKDPEGNLVEITI